MSLGYDTVGCEDFFVCAGGATAVLSGLIFVALSINFEKVLEIDKGDGQNFLTGRALEGLVDLLIVLGVSIVALTPEIARVVMAAVILLCRRGERRLTDRVLIASRGQPGLGTATLVRIETAGALTITPAAAGLTVAVPHGGGVYWLPAAFGLAITIAAVNAWVLLVEVLR